MQNTPMSKSQKRKARRQRNNARRVEYKGKGSDSKARVATEQEAKLADSKNRTRNQADMETLSYELRDLLVQGQQVALDIEQSGRELTVDEFRQFLAMVGRVASQAAGVVHSKDTNRRKGLKAWYGREEKAAQAVVSDFDGMTVEEYQAATAAE